MEGRDEGYRRFYENTDSYLKDKYLETDFDLDTFALSQENDGTWQVSVTGKNFTSLLRITTIQNPK